MIRARRKKLKKVKRLVAAMAGAAVMSSALLPAVSAAELPAKQQAPITEKAPAAAKAPAQTEADKATSQRTSPLQAARKYAAAQGYDTDRADFSLEWRSDSEASVLMTNDRGRDYRIRLYKNDAGEWKVRSIDSIRDSGSANYYSGNPVDVVKDNAARFGFDADTDHFTLLSRTGSKAIVQVHRPGGQTFKVDLERSNGSWEITVIRGIGNIKYPATYIPASMFPHNTVVAAPVVSPENQQTLFNTHNYDGWTWKEKTYPSDMYFGIFTQNPRQSDSANVLPDAVLKVLGDLDYNKSLVFYATLGSVGYKGYGIGIEKVTQAGNTLFVTVRTKSPSLNDTSFTKAYDYVTVDRGSIDFSKAVHVHFITPEGYALSWYTFLPQ